MHYQGELFRALNPVWAREPLSGEGARRFGGRFNPKGLPALYTSRSVMTALREANQIGSLQPTTLVAYEADLGPIFDANDPALLAGHGLTPADLAADDWRVRMQAEGRSPTQRFAEALIAEGFSGMQIRSFAAGAGTGADTGTGPEDLNLVLWRWQPGLTLIDDENRLGRA